MGMKVNGTSGLTFPDTTTLGSAGQSSVQAWVNFNGTGTVSIRANFNVSSITDNGTGDYTVNFATAMVDDNYCFVGLTSFASGVTTIFAQQSNLIAPTTTSIRMISANQAGNVIDTERFNVAIFR